MAATIRDTLGMPRSLVIDTDTASDDAIALLLAVRDPEVAVRAVTVVAGNVPLPLAVRNAIVTLDLCGASDIEVHAGAASPLSRSLETAQYVHGEDGMGGVSLPDPSRQETSADAVAQLVAFANEQPGLHELVTLGPLTNVALALREDPELLAKYKCTTMMLGSPDGVGNVNALGEYNAWADPEATAAVLEAPGTKTMVGWNISRRYAVITPVMQDRLRSLGRLGAFAVAINAVVDQYCRDTGLAGYDLPDPIAMAIAIDDTIATDASDEFLVVGLDGPTRGATLPDRRFERPAPTCRVIWEADQNAFLEKLVAACTL